MSLVMLAFGLATLGGVALAFRRQIAAAYGEVTHPDGSREVWGSKGGDIVKWGGIAGVTIMGLSVAFVNSPAGLMVIRSAWSAPDTFMNAVNVLYPNIPGGMTTLTQWDGTDLTVTDWSYFNPCSSLQADGGGIVNPLGTGSSVRIDYVAGSGSQCGGAWFDDSANNVFPGGPYNVMYVMYRKYIDPTWAESPEGQKEFSWDSLSAGNPSKYYFTRAPGGSGPRNQMTVQDNVGGPTFSSDNFWLLGAWNNVELLHNTDVDSVWVYNNGVLAAAGAVTADTDLTGLNIWLSRNGAHGQSEYFLIGEFLIAVKN